MRHKVDALSPASFRLLVWHNALAPPWTRTPKRDLKADLKQFLAAARTRIRAALAHAGSQIIFSSPDGRTAPGGANVYISRLDVRLTVLAAAFDYAEREQMFVSSPARKLPRPAFDPKEKKRSP